LLEQINLMKKKIFFLTENFFTKFDFSKFKIKLLSKYFLVEVVDFTSFLSKKYYLKYAKKNLSFRNKSFTYYKIQNVNDLKFFIQKIKKINYKTFIVDSLSNTVFNLKIKKNLFKLNNVKSIHISHNYPSGNFIFSPLSYLKLFIINWRNYLLLFSKKKIIKYDYNFLTSNYNFFTSNCTDSKKIFFTNTFDYENFLDENKKINKSTISNKPYAVFLDEMMPNHPDYEKLDIRPPISSKAYKEIIHNFFYYFEKKLKMKIVIARHPKDHFIKKDKDIFEKFRNYSDCTLSLVKYSKLVLLHASTSVSYAIMFKKPLLYINSNEFGWMKKRINIFHNNTGGKIVYLPNINQNNFKDKIYEVNSSRYKNYLNSYIKHPNASNSLFESIVQCIKVS